MNKKEKKMFKIGQLLKEKNYEIFWKVIALTNYGYLIERYKGQGSKALLNGEENLYKAV
jgi:hypothetical protein